VETLSEILGVEAERKHSIFEARKHLEKHAIEASAASAR
jgi:hypothetical protein